MLERTRRVVAPPEQAVARRTPSRTPRWRRFVGVAVVGALGALGFTTAAPVLPASAANTSIPTQWIAKQYTELLGRTPTADEWYTAVAHYGTPVTCDATSLAWLGTDLANSNTFKGMYPATTRLEKALRISAVIRAAYNHDMNDSDWTNYVVPLDGNAKTWEETVANIYGSTGFATWIVPAACSTTTPAYGFSYSKPLDLRAKAGLPASRTQAAIQALLDAAPSGTTVTLLPGEVIRVGGATTNVANPNQNLRVPAGVTLTTAGTWSHPVGSGLPYARLGRIVVDGPDAAVCFSFLCNDIGLVSLTAGATLANTWVDGQATGSGAYKMANIESAGSTAANPTVIRDNRASDPGRDGTGIRTRGWSSSTTQCTSETVSGNVVTGYASSHALDSMGLSRAARGIAVMCESASVTQNQIADVTDSGIVVYGSYNSFFSQTAVQGSTISANTVLSAGLDAQVALGADAIGECASAAGWLVPCLDRIAVRPFTGSTISGNAFWTGPRTSFDIGLLVGGGARWGDHHVTGDGIKVQNNLTGSATRNIVTRVNIGISVDAMTNAVVTGNTAAYTLVDGSPGQTWRKCPLGHALKAAASHASVASGAQALTLNDNQHGCLIGDVQAGGLDRIVTSSDGNGFVGATTQRAFTPWALDMEIRGLVLSDTTVWNTIVDDVREQRRMGANMIRVLMEFDQLVGPPSIGWPDGTPKASGITFLTNLATLANQTGVYLDFTGLGFQLPHNVPTWDDGLDEAGWWRAHRTFWTAAAGALKTTNAVAWYDLMNEPKPTTTNQPVSGYSAWCWGLAPGYDVCYNPVLTRTPGTRTAKQIGQAWTQMMVSAVRATGDTHLVSVGLTAGAGASLTPSDLTAYGQSFGMVHVYPCYGRTDACTAAAIQDDINLTIASKPAGQPLVVEETGSQWSGGTQLDNYLAGTRGHAAGWVLHQMGGITPSQLATTIAAQGGIPIEAFWLSALRDFMRNTFKMVPTGPAAIQP